MPELSSFIVFSIYFNILPACTGRSLLDDFIFLVLQIFAVDRKISASDLVCKVSLETIFYFLKKDWPQCAKTCNTMGLFHIMLVLEGGNVLILAHVINSRIVFCTLYSELTQSLTPLTAVMFPL